MKKFYKELFESPDSIIVNDREINYNGKDTKQRSFIVFPSKEIWVGAIGDTHDDIHKYPVESVTLYNTVAGRVWLDHNIISFWYSLVSKYDKNFMVYLNALEDKLKSYNIDLKSLKFDAYESWRGIGKKICDAKSMVTYYSDRETPLDDYDTYVDKMNNWLQMCLKHDTPNLPPIKPMGSPGTAWDSKNSIKFRQSRSTSESFYPMIFK